MAVIDRAAISRTIAQQIQYVTHHSVPFDVVCSRVECPQGVLCFVYPLIGNHRLLLRQWCNERWTSTLCLLTNPPSACNITIVGFEFGDTVSEFKDPFHSLITDLLWELQNLHRYCKLFDEIRIMKVLSNDLTPEVTSSSSCPPKSVGDNLVALHFKYDQARRRFVEWAPNEIAVVPDFHKRILFSDEAHFWLNGYVNKQNCRIWSEANPQVYVETPLHPEKLTVWCALWAGGITGPYFFKNDEGHNVTVNGDRYRAIITNFFIPELNNHDVQELWFQQDGATCHTARATIDLLKDTFGDRLISRFGPVNWPPRTCDLTRLDYFLWGYVKSLVYADKPQTLDHLEDNIRRVIADIWPQMLEKVIEN
ncbi:uncharacterized protein TNCV_4490251 [Trichonephila clavipes]|nr:uncharacterized protein TNCV_4490251 [Trichonephila clavipes]